MKHKPSPEALFQLEELLEQGSFGETTSLCNKLLSIYPENPDLLFIKAIALQHSNKIEESIRIFTLICDQYPHFLDVWPQLAYAYFEFLEYDIAQEKIQMALQKNPSDAYSWWLYALIREHKGNLFGAQRAYQTAQELEPELYPSLPTLTEERIIEYVEAASLLLPSKNQSQLHCLLWSVVEIPMKHQLQQLRKTPLEPLFYVDRLHAHLYIFRQNIRRYLILSEHIPSRMAQELVLSLPSLPQMEA